MMPTMPRRDGPRDAEERLRGRGIPIVDTEPFPDDVHPDVVGVLTHAELNGVDGPAVGMAVRPGIDDDTRTALFTYAEQLLNRALVHGYEMDGWTLTMGEWPTADGTGVITRATWYVHLRRVDMPDMRWLER